MNELLRSVTYLATTGLLAILAIIVSLSRETEVKEDDLVDKPLISDFDDPTSAAKIRIVKFDQQNGVKEDFTIQRKKSRWVIPDMQDYPADNNQRVSKAAGGFVALDVIAVPGEEKKFHPVYGVLNPDDDGERNGAEADQIGTLVEVFDSKQNSLANLVIGKEVKGEADKRFVRIAGQDHVYVVKLDASTYSTNITDWFDRKIVKFQGDLHGMKLIHSGKTNAEGEKVEVSSSELTFDKSKWTLVKASELIDGKPTEQKLTDNEEVRTEKIDGLKSKLEAININTIMGGSDAPSNPELGEIIVDEKSGVRISIRFGQAEKIRGGNARMIMLDASVNESLLPKPELEEIPKVTNVATKKSEGDDKKDGDKKDGDKKGEEKKAVTEADRKAAQERNQLKLDSWKDKKQQAEARVADLNYRYKNWIFLIQDTDFEQLRTSRYQIVKEKKSVDGVDVYRDLISKGLKVEEKKEDDKK